MCHVVYICLWLTCVWVRVLGRGVADSTCWGPNRPTRPGATHLAHGIHHSGTQAGNTLLASATVDDNSEDDDEVMLDIEIGVEIPGAPGPRGDSNVDHNPNNSNDETHGARWPRFCKHAPPSSLLVPSIEAHGFPVAGRPGAILIAEREYLYLKSHTTVAYHPLFIPAHSVDDSVSSTKSRSHLYLYW